MFPTQVTSVPDFSSTDQTIKQYTYTSTLSRHISFQLNSTKEL